MTNTRITDAEMLEAPFPGPARRASRCARDRAARGGDAAATASCARYASCGPCRVSLLTRAADDRRRSGSPGGEPGARGSQSGPAARDGRVRRSCGGSVELALEAGDELWIETPGGGGFGAREIARRASLDLGLRAPSNVRPGA